MAEEKKHNQEEKNDKEKEERKKRPAHPLPGNLDAQEEFDESSFKNPDEVEENNEEENAEEGEEEEQKAPGEGEPYDKTGQSPLNFVEYDTEEHQVDAHSLDEETQEDSLFIGTYKDEVASQMAEFSDDPDVIQDLEERQETGAGSDQMLDRLSEHHAKSPEVSADDVDADWDASFQSGEEAVGGTNPTPDQDRVDDLGEAVGLEYEDDEPLNTLDKLAARDRNRWEFNPASQQDFEEQVESSPEGWTDETTIEAPPEESRRAPTPPGGQPPMQVSEEATEDELQMARSQGEQYLRALRHMVEDVAYDGGEQTADDYFVAYAVEEAEGMYNLVDGELEWRAPEKENTHIEISVRDRADNRFIPGLKVTVTVLDAEGEIIGKHVQPMLWHPWLYHYGRNWYIPEQGEYTLRVLINAPDYPRHDEDNGKRYSKAVEVEFRGVTLAKQRED